MDIETIKKLNTINREFYRTTAEAFDKTRAGAWQGWSPLIPYLSTPLKVLDIGCGNGRFGAFLAETLEGPITYHGLDNSTELLAYARTALTDEYPNLDITLTERDIVMHPPDEDLYDLVVLFGVIHHIPGLRSRLRFMEKIAQRVRQGGILAFASWRFYEFERFRERIIPWDDDIQVEAGDYLLDWKAGDHAIRYCHYVSDAEQDQLIKVSNLTELERYRADGFNCYSILRH